MINEKQRKFAINFILYIFCFIFISFIGISKSLAYSYTNIGELRDITQQLVSTNYGNAPFENPVNSGYAFNEVLEVSYIISNYSFSANVNYQLESHLTNQQLTNANYYSVTGYNGEACLISYQNSIFQDEYPRWAFQCSHNTNTITISIRNSSNEYLWSGTGIFTWTTALLKSSDTSLGSDGGNNSDAIINNQNQNTQSIINNQNQNTQEIINSNKVCYADNLLTSLSFTNAYISSNGIITSSNDNGLFDMYISVLPNTEYIFSANRSLGNMAVSEFNSSKTFIRRLSTTSSSSYTFTTGNNTSFVRVQFNYGGGTVISSSLINGLDFMFEKGSTRNNQICKNGNQAVTDSVNDLNDTLEDDDISDATNEASDFFGDFTTNTFGLTSIITAPLNLIQSLTSSTCSQLELPLPYLDNKKLILPCMSDIYSNYFGTFFTMYQTITYGIIAYWVCVRLFNLVKDFKNPEHDEIEVVDL